MAEGNGFRVTSREVYQEVVACRQEISALRDLLLEERGRLDSLTTQIRLLWTLSFATVGTIVAAAIKVVS